LRNHVTMLSLWLGGHDENSKYGDSMTMRRQQADTLHPYIVLGTCN